MTLVAAGGGWWFVTGDELRPFDGIPVVGVDPADGTVGDVAGNLAMLAALAPDGTMSPDRCYLVAPVKRPMASPDSPSPNVRFGTVRNADLIRPPLTFAPDGVHILSATVSGPTVTTLIDGGGTEIVPVFDIDLPNDADVDLGG